MKHISDVEDGSKTLKAACHKSAGLQSSAIVMFIHLTLVGVYVKEITRLRSNTY